jgi:hypothetical protein
LDESSRPRVTVVVAGMRCAEVTCYVRGLVSTYRCAEWTGIVQPYVATSRDQTGQVSILQSHGMALPRWHLLSGRLGAVGCYANPVTLDAHALKVSTRYLRCLPSPHHGYVGRTILFSHGMNLLCLEQSVFALPDSQRKHSSECMRPTAFPLKILC